MGKLGKAIGAVEHVADHPLFLKAFGWLMSPDRVAMRAARRSARRAARRQRRRERRRERRRD